MSMLSTCQGLHPLLVEGGCQEQCLIGAVNGNWVMSRQLSPGLAQRLSVAHGLLLSSWPLRLHFSTGK
jgi:hypothetical protein